MSNKYPSGYDKKSVGYLDLEFKGKFGASNFGNHQCIDDVYRCKTRQEHIRSRNNSHFLNTGNAGTGHI